MANELIAHTTDSSFVKDVLESDIPVLVDFWADWCGPCLALTPTLNEVAEEYSGKLKICKVNVDENQMTAAQYAIRSIPTLMLFKQGELQEITTGSLPKGILTKFIEKYI